MAKKNKELTLVRTINAPRASVWEAWTDPKITAEWWGPDGVTNPVFGWDARPDGKIAVVMRAGEKMGKLAGTEWPMRGTFRDVTEQERLAFTSGAVYNENEEPQLETITIVTFKEASAGRTEMTVHIKTTRMEPGAKEAVAGMEEGWNQSLDKLSEVLGRNTERN